MPVAGFNRPGDGAGIKKGIKSIQKVTVSYTSNNQNVTIAPVDPTKTIVIMEYGTNGNGVANLQYSPTVELTSPTNILITSYGTQGNMEVNITVIEFTNVKSKQTGIFTSTGTGTGAVYNVAISGVNPSKCLAFAYYTNSNSATSVNMTSAIVTSSTNLSIHSSGGTGAYGTLKWQVIELL